MFEWLLVACVDLLDVAEKETTQCCEERKAKPPRGHRVGTMREQTLMQTTPSKTRIGIELE